MEGTANSENSSSSSNSSNSSCLSSTVDDAVKSTNNDRGVIPDNTSSSINSCNNTENNGTDTINNNNSKNASNSSSNSGNKVNSGSSSTTIYDMINNNNNNNSSMFNGRSITRYETNRILDNLEERILLCEYALGVNTNHNDNFNSNIASTSIGTRDVDYSAAAAGSSLGSELAYLVWKTNQLITGKLSLFINAYNRLEKWLETDSCSISSVILSIQAKKLYIYSNYNFIVNTAKQFTALENLSGFVNPPQLSELEAYKERIHELNRKGKIISEQAIQLDKRLNAIAQDYNTTMNMVSALFKEWDCLISAAEESCGGRHNDTKKPISSVQYADLGEAYATGNGGHSRVGNSIDISPVT